MREYEFYAGRRAILYSMACLNAWYGRLADTAAGWLPLVGGNLGEKCRTPAELGRGTLQHATDLTLRYFDLRLSKTEV